MTEETTTVEPQVVVEYALWCTAILLMCVYGLLMPLHLVALTFSRLWLHTKVDSLKMTHKESTRNPALTLGAVETVGPMAQQLPHLNYHGQNGHHKLNGFSAHIEVGSGPLSLVNGFPEHGSIIQPPGLMCLQPMIREEEVGVTIIKPLIGYDPNLKVNLESFFKLDYLNYEIIFCIGELHNGPSLPVVQELMALYPSVPVRIYQGGEQCGINPKINNMLPGYRNARFNVLWICDSGIKADPIALRELTHHMKSDPKIALVHQLPYVAPVQDIVGYLDKVYFGTYHSRMYILATLGRMNCANGMSWLVRRDALEQEGGLEIFNEYLAEDFFMSQALIDRGWKAVLSTLPALQNPGNRSFTAFQARIKRWCRLRCTINPFISRLEPFVECFGLGLLGALSSHYLLGISILLFLSLHLLFWFACDLALLRSIENGPIGSIWKIAIVWFFREVWTFPIFLGGAFSKEINWRGQHYKLTSGGKAVKLN